MILLEIIAQFFVEVIFVEGLYSSLVKINDKVLKLRGNENVNTDEKLIKKLKRNYLYKRVKIKQGERVYSGKKGSVMEFIDTDKVYVEFDEFEDGVRIGNYYKLTELKLLNE